MLGDSKQMETPMQPAQCKADAASIAADSENAVERPPADIRYNEDS
jgi:hypothetical protein